MTQIQFNSIGRAIVAIIGGIVLTSPLQAQWTNGSGGAIYYNGGNVGVGTTSPTFSLDLSSPSVYAARFSGTGTCCGGTPDTEVHINSNGPASGYAQIDFDDKGTGIWGIYKDTANQFNISHLGMAPLLMSPPAGNALYLMPVGGNVGIGTTNPQHPLQVAGTIGAEEILVTSTGADYVFRSGYRLQPLSEVATYIETNHHLPDIPSEAEVKEKGLGVGEMEAKLLAKIEELTLHMIQQEKENGELRDRIAKLENGTGTTPTGAK
jgi:hypothetical protein